MTEPTHVELNKQYDDANKMVGRSLSEWNYRHLCEVVRDVITGAQHPFALSDHAAAAIQRGVPVDPGALFKDAKVLETEARYIALLLPSLSRYHQDCKLWLADKLKKPVDAIQGSIPWNLVAGGAAINASGD